RDNSPFGPFTETVLPSRVKSTVSGTGTGIFPTRLMSPHLGHDLATESTPPGFPVGHHSLRRGDDRHTQAALDPGKLTGTAIDPVTGLRDPTEALDDRSAPVAVPQHEHQLAPRIGLRDLVAVDKTFGREHPGQGLL